MCKDSNNDSFGTHSVKVLVQVHYPCGTKSLLVLSVSYLQVQKPKVQALESHQISFLKPEEGKNLLDLRSESPVNF